MRGPADIGHATTDDRLAHAIGQAILAADGRSPLDPGAAEDQLEIVVRAAEAERVARELLHQAVGAARAGGQSWAAVGARLGMSRQAVQQRFAFRNSEPEPSGSAPAEAPRHRWLGPVSAFDELPELQRAGRLGWHTVGAGMLRHRLVQTDTQWEHRRIVWAGSLRRYQNEGWLLGCRAFPWIYLIRDLGLPPVPVEES